MQFDLDSSTGRFLTSPWTLRACLSLPPALPCPMLSQPPPGRFHRLSGPPRHHMPLTVSICSLLPPYPGQMHSYTPGAGPLSQQAQATAPGLQAGTLLLLPGRILSLGSTDYSVTCSCTLAALSGGFHKKRRTSAWLSACLKHNRSHRQCHIQHLIRCLAGHHLVLRQCQSSSLRRAAKKKT